jgi:hypothetical protein
MNASDTKYERRIVAEGSYESQQHLRRQIHECSLKSHLFALNERKALEFDPTGHERIWK